MPEKMRLGGTKCVDALTVAFTL